MTARASFRRSVAACILSALVATAAAAGAVEESVDLPVQVANIGGWIIGHSIRNTASQQRAFERFPDTCCGFADAAAGTPHALADTPDAFTQALAAWTSRHKVRSAVVVVRRDGRIAYRAGIGGGDPDAAYHLASLSKAITGACIATLVGDGTLGFETPLANALARFFEANGKPADPRIERATIAQLLTHRGGFSGAEDGDDAATGTNLKAYLVGHSATEPPHPAYLTAVLGTKLARDPGRQFAYSNAGYLVLGAVVEEATGRSYENFCRGAVLTPAGAAGELEPTWRVMSSYGGWRMRGADYLAFLEQLDPAAAKLGSETRDWMLDRIGKTYGRSSYPVWYGPGIRLRDAGRGIEITVPSWRAPPRLSACRNPLSWSPAPSPTGSPTCDCPGRRS